MASIAALAPASARVEAAVEHAIAIMDARKMHTPEHAVSARILIDLTEIILAEYRQDIAMSMLPQ